MKQFAFATSLAVIGGLFAIDLPQAQAQGGCPVAGRYSLVGRTPMAESYRGEAVITARGGGCHVRWLPPNDSEGTGSYVDGVLTIYFTFAGGGSGVVRYVRASNGELNGSWSMNADPGAQGTESLRPL